RLCPPPQPRPRSPMAPARTSPSPAPPPAAPASTRATSSGCAPRRSAPGSWCRPTRPAEPTAGTARAPPRARCTSESGSQTPEVQKWVRGVHLMRNYGQHNAVLCGIRLARHDVIVTLDDDLQHPPEEIPKLLEKLSDDKDVVYGPPAQETHGLWRDLASQVTKIAL